MGQQEAAEEEEAALLGCEESPSFLAWRGGGACYGLVYALSQSQFMITHSHQEWGIPIATTGG